MRLAVPWYGGRVRGAPPPSFPGRMEGTVWLGAGAWNALDARNKPNIKLETYCHLTSSPLLVTRV